MTVFDYQHINKSTNYAYLLCTNEKKIITLLYQMTVKRLKKLKSIVKLWQNVMEVEHPLYTIEGGGGQ